MRRAGAKLHTPRLHSTPSAGGARWRASPRAQAFAHGARAQLPEPGLCAQSAATGAATAE